MIIYKTTNLINEKSYIGQDSKNNPDYLGSGDYLKNSIKKHGRKNFQKEIMAWCDTKEHFNFLEKFYIDFFNTRIPKGYNITDGGNGGNLGLLVNKKISEKLKGCKRPDMNGNLNPSKRLEVRQKISKALKGRKTPWNCGDFSSTKRLEVRRKISEGLSGHEVSKETRKKISLANFGKRCSEKTRKKISLTISGENHPNYGKYHSKETKRKMSEVKVGKHHSEETRKKMSEVRVGRTFPRLNKVIISKK